MYKRQILLVSESGLKDATDGQRVLNAGANAILVGESLMRATTPQEGIAAYLDLVAAPEPDEDMV